MFCFRSYSTAPRIKEIHVEDEENGPAFPAIMEENEDDFSRASSPAFVEIAAFSTGGGGEKRDSELIPVMPWRGLLKKSTSKVNLND